jgi:hypothetical protein
LVGLLAVLPRKADTELWICLPGGLSLLLALGGLLYWALWQVPRLTVSRFALDGDELRLETPALGSVTRPLSELRWVIAAHRVRGRRLLGWWLKFEGVSRVYLTRSTPNAEQLVLQIGPRAAKKAPWW